MSPNAETLGDPWMRDAYCNTISTMLFILSTVPPIGPKDMSLVRTAEVVHSWIILQGVGVKVISNRCSFSCGLCGRVPGHVPEALEEGAACRFVAALAHGSDTPFSTLLAFSETMWVIFKTRSCKRPWLPSSAQLWHTQHFFEHLGLEASLPMRGTHPKGCCFSLLALHRLLEEINFEKADQAFLSDISVHGMTVGLPIQ